MLIISCQIIAIIIGFTSFQNTAIINGFMPRGLNGDHVLVAILGNYK